MTPRSALSTKIEEEDEREADETHSAIEALVVPKEDDQQRKAEILLTAEGIVSRKKKVVRKLLYELKFYTIIIYFIII